MAKGRQRNRVPREKGIQVSRWANPKGGGGGLSFKGKGIQVSMRANSKGGGMVEGSTLGLLVTIADWACFLLLLLLTLVEKWSIG